MISKVEITQLQILRKDGDRMTERLAFDYSRLRGRIVEKFGTQNGFAVAMGMSEGTLSGRLTNKSYFTAEEIVMACQLLDISLDEVNVYFFAVKV